MQPIGLYLHIPFCDGKCHYCNFYSMCADERTMSQYTAHTAELIRLWGARLDRTVDTVYFGGGTPSLLGGGRLATLLSAVKDSFALADDAEVTLEANPTSADALDFAALYTTGFNRLSIGLQSADDRELRTLGRRHSAADAARTVRLAQEAGFDNISLDVMLGVPYQTGMSLERTLSFCSECRVQHVSAYILKIEEGTPFFHKRATLPLLSDDEQAAFYEDAVSRLGELGYEQYEISNFALPGYEGRHNLHYWHDEEYLGLGPSAHSFLNGRRFYFGPSFDDFYTNRTVFESTGGDAKEYIMLALRLKEGLSLSAYAQRFGRPVSHTMLDAALKLQSNGLLTVSDRAVRLTVKGFLVSNSVIAYLLQNT